MKEGLVPGTQKEVSYVVTPAMCPAFGGEVVHQVCSTWEIVHYMEVAGRMVLLDFLEPHEEGVGSHASCDHMGPAPVGSTVRVVATATDVSERELSCDCAAFRGDRMIAAGKTVQKVFPREVLERILKKA
ncbi:MAG: hotdog domain-containing protein [Planctomycetota bacterium]